MKLYSSLKSLKLALDLPVFISLLAGTSLKSHPVRAQSTTVRSFSIDCNFTWVGGDSTSNVANSDTVFGARWGHTMAVANGSGQVYVFGGTTAANEFFYTSWRNDLWQWSPASRLWTRLTGTTTVNVQGVYTSVGSSGLPGSRMWHAMTIDPSTDQIYLFGGNGYDGSGNSGLMNDLWQFDPATTIWIWVDGSPYLGQQGIYGTRGVPAGANHPGSRNRHSMIFASQTLVVFGGNGNAATSSGRLNDLWQYNIQTKLWTWWRGTTGVGGIAVAKLFSFYAESTPSARHQHAMAIDSRTGIATMFGGSISTGSSNELWLLDTSTMMWAWYGGNMNEAGCQLLSYGVRGVAAPENFPGIRSSHSMAVVPQTGAVIVFGGVESCIGTAATLNDMWLWDPTTRYWTWLEGQNPSIEFVKSIYGTFGVPSAANSPGGRRDFAISTHSTTGALYIVGGLFGANWLNDLWQIPPTNKLCPQGTTLYGDSCLTPDNLAKFLFVSTAVPTATRMITTSLVIASSTPNASPALISVPNSSSSPSSTSASPPSTRPPSVSPTPSRPPPTSPPLSSSPSVSTTPSSPPPTIPPSVSTTPSSPPPTIPPSVSPPPTSPPPSAPAPPPPSGDAASTSTQALPVWFLPVILSATGCIFMVLVIGTLMSWRSIRIQQQMQTEFQGLTTDMTMTKMTVGGRTSQYLQMRSSQMEEGRRGSNHDGSNRHHRRDSNQKLMPSNSRRR